MKKRWRYYIDKEFQNQFVIRFSVILIISGLFTVGLLWLVKEKSYNLLPGNASVLVQVDTENALAISFIDGKLTLDEENGQNYFPLKRIGKNPPKLYNAFDLYALPILATSILNIVVVSIFSIFFSHKMAGPIKRIKNTLEAYSRNPKEYALIQLRKGDFFQDLAEALNKAFLSKKNKDQ